MITRVAPFAQQNLSLFHTLNTQTRLADLQLQIATGKVAQTYSGIAPDAQRLVSSETLRARSQQFTTNIDIVDTRLELMDLSMEQIESVSRDFRGTLAAAVNGPDGFDGNLSAIADDMRRLITESLNTRDANGYLFGGTRSDRPPVNLTSPPFTSMSLIKADGTTVDRGFYESYFTDVLGNSLPFPAGSFYDQIFFDKNGVAPSGPLPADPDNPTLSEFVAEDPDLFTYYVDRLDSPEMLANPTTSYYQGDTNAHRVRADDRLELNYDVRADDLAFQQIMLALDVVSNLPNGGDPRNNFEREIVAKAKTMVERVLDPRPFKGISGLNNLRTELVNTRDELAFARERQQSFKVFAEGLIDETEGIDKAEVIAKLQAEQLALEASYSTIARLQQLSLVNFL